MRLVGSYADLLVTARLAMPEWAFWHASFGIPIDVPGDTVALRVIGLDDDGRRFYECGCEGGAGGWRYCSTHIGALQAGAPVFEIDLLAYAAEFAPCRNVTT